VPGYVCVPGKCIKQNIPLEYQTAIKKSLSFLQLDHPTICVLNVYEPRHLFQIAKNLHRLSDKSLKIEKLHIIPVVFDRMQSLSSEKAILQSGPYLLLMITS